MRRLKTKLLSLSFLLFIILSPYLAFYTPLLLQNLLFNPNGGSTFGSGSNLSVRSEAGSEIMDSYSGSDSGIFLTEYALNSTMTTAITVGMDTATAYVNTVEGWTGQQIYSTINTAREIGQWIPNSTFPSGANGWTYIDNPPSPYAEDDVISRYNDSVSATADGSGSYEVVINGSSGQFPNDISDGGAAVNNGDLVNNGTELLIWNRSVWGDASAPFVSNYTDIAHVGTDGNSSYIYDEAIAPTPNTEVSKEGGVYWRQEIDLFPSSTATESLDITRIRINYSASARIQLSRGGAFRNSATVIGTAKLWIKFGPGTQSSDAFMVVLEQYSESDENTFDGWADWEDYIDVPTVFLTGYDKCQIEFGLDYIAYAKSVKKSDCSTMVTIYGGMITCEIDYDEKIEANNEVYAERTTDIGLENREILGLDFQAKYRGDQFIDATNYYPFVQLVDSNGVESQRYRLIIDGTTDLLDLNATTVATFQDVTVLSTGDLKTWLNSRILAGAVGPFKIRVGIDFKYENLPTDQKFYYYFDEVELILNTSVRPETIDLRLMDGGTPHAYAGSIGSGSVSFSGTYATSPTFSFATNSSYNVTMNCYLELNQTQSRLLDYNFSTPYGTDYSKVQWLVENDVSSNHLANLYDYEFLTSVPNDWVPLKIVKPSSPAETYSLAANVSGYFYVIDTGAVNNSVQLFSGLTDQFAGTPQTGTYEVYFLSDNTVNDASMGTSLYYLSETPVINVDTQPDTLGTYTGRIWRIYDENDNPVIELVYNNSQAAGSPDFSDNSWAIPSDLSNVGTFRYDITWNNSISGSPVTKVGIANVTFEVHVHTSAQVDVRALQSEYILPGNIFLQPQFLQFLGNWSTIEGNQRISDGEMWLNYTDSDGSPQNYTYSVEYDTGNYSVEFNTLLMAGGNQTVQLILQKKYFETQVNPLVINQTVDVIYSVVTPIDVLGNARYAEVYYSDDYNASLRLYDRYNLSEPITNASAVTISIQNIYNPGDNGVFAHNTSDPTGNLWYYEINTDQGEDYLYYEVTIQVDYGDGVPYEENRFNVTIKVLWEETIIWWTEASVTSKGTDGTFHIYAKNASDGMFLENADLYVTNITNMSNPIALTEAADFRVDAEPSNMRYQVTVFSNDTATWPIGTYVFRVDVNKTNHFNHSTQIPYTIRSVTTAATYDPIGLTTYRNPLNITLYYRNIDAGEAGIPGATIQITGSENEIFTEGKNLTIHDEGDGSYVLELNTTNCTYSTVYKLNVSISKQDFLSQNLSGISFSFRETDTLLDIDGSVNKLITVDKNNEFNLTFWYIDVKEAVTIENETGINNITLGYVWYTRASPASSWTLNNTVKARTTIMEEDYAGGQNNQWVFNVNATDFNFTLTYLLVLNASKLGYETAYLNATVSLRRSYSRIGVISPTPTVYNEPVEFYVSYTDEAGISVLSTDNFYNLSWRPEGVSTWTEITESPSTWNWTYANSTPDLSVGNELKIWFNTSCIPFPDVSFGYHYLNVSISQGQYDPQSTYFRLYVNPIDAQLFYDPPPIVGIGDWSTFNVYYKDTRNNQFINASVPNPVSIVMDLNDTEAGSQGIEGSDYLVSWLPSQATYNVSVNTSYWGAAGIETIVIHANWSGVPYYNNVSVTLNIQIRNTTSELSYIPYDTIPYGENMEGFKIRFTDLDANAPIDLNSEPSARVLLNNGTEYDITSYLDASFDNQYNNITFIQTDNLAIGSHILNITVTLDNYNTATRLIPITIRPHYTYLSASRPFLTPFGDNATVELYWEDIDYNVGINVTNPTDMNLSFSLGIDDWLDDPTKAWWTYGPSDGYFYVTVNTSKLSTYGEEDFTVTLEYLGTPKMYQNSTADTKISTRERYTQIFYDLPPIVGIGDWSSFNVYYQDTATGGLINETIPNPVNIYVDLNDTLAGLQGNQGTDYLVVWLPSQAAYNISINTSYWSVPGTKDLRIFANYSGSPFYNNVSIPISLNVREISSEFSYISYGSIPFSDNIYGFKIRYTDLDSGTPINLSTEPTARVLLNNGTEYDITSYLDSSFVNNYNNITFIQTDNLAIGDHFLNITITIDNYVPISREIPITIRAHHAFLAVTRPPMTPFGQNATVELYWQDLDYDLGINVTNPSNLNLTFTLGADDWLDDPTKAWWTYGPSDGYYYITVNTSKLSGYGDSNFELGLNYIGPNLEYENATLNTTISTRERYTQIIYEAPPVVGIGEWSSFNIYYKDIEINELINTTLNGQLNILVDLNDTAGGMQGINGTDYLVEWLPALGAYNVSIDTGYWSQSGAMPIRIYSNWTGAPHYANQTLSLNINVREITSELSFYPYGSIPYGENIHGLNIRFTNLDTGLPVNLATEPSARVYLNNGTEYDITSYLDSSFVNNYNNITFIDTDDYEIGDYALNVTVSVDDYVTAQRLIPITIRQHYTYFSIANPPTLPFGENATIDVYWKDLDYNVGINVTNPLYIEFELILGVEDWMNDSQKAWWSYGPSNGSYYININTSQFNVYGDYEFLARVSFWGSHDDYGNSTMNVTISTRQRFTFLAADPYGTPYYGEELLITLNYYDLDDPNEDLKLITSTSTQFDFFTQSGVYEVDSRTIRIVTDEFITQDRLSTKELMVGLNWTGGAPFYKNQTLNISIKCRQVETYRTVFMGNDTAGTIETESYTGWPWGSPINMTITYINIDDPSQSAINSSTINVTADGVYAIPGNFQVLGWNGGNWVQQYTSVNGTFKIVLNTTVANNNQLYTFNITLFNSSDPDEPYKNQTFQLLVSFRKPITVLVMEYVPGVSIPWGTNATILVEYQNVEAGNEAISGADVNITVTQILEDGVPVDVRYGYPSLAAYLSYWNWTVDNNVTIAEYLHGVTPRYNITFNTTWCNNTQWQITIYANKTEVSTAVSYATVSVRDILTNLNLLSPASSIIRQDELDRDTNHSDWRNGTKYFNMTVQYIDLDASAPGYIESNITDLRYENIQFYYYDSYSGNYSAGVSPDDNDYSTWGMSDLNWHGNFTVEYIGNGKYVISLHCNESLPFHDGLYLTFKVNGTHLRGTSITEEHAEASATIKIRLRIHATSATIDPNYTISGEKIVPNLPSDGVFDTVFDGNITYGEDFNVSVFWYDLNNSLIAVPGKRNQTGVPVTAFANVTCDGLFGVSGLSSMEGLYYVHNLYNQMSGSPVRSNYTGVYNFEIKTSLMHYFYPYIDLVNGGPNGDGRYNLTINLWFMSQTGTFDTEYNLSSVTFEIKVNRINTSLSFRDITYAGGQSTNGTTLVPFGIPGSNFYFNLKLNYTYADNGIGYSAGDPISHSETWNLSYYNSSGMLESWELAKARYEPGTPQILRIYTDTVDTANHTKIPWNSTGYKNVTFQISFNRTNYLPAELNISVYLYKHNTSVVWLPNGHLNDFFTIDYTYEKILSYREVDEIYFKYIDETAIDLNFQIQSIRNAYVWNNWSSPISETSIAGVYLLNLSADVDASAIPYFFEVWANDTHPAEFRNISLSVWNFTCDRADTSVLNIDWDDLLSGPQIYQFLQQVIFSGEFYNEWGEPLAGTITYTIKNDLGVIVKSGSVQCVGGRFDVSILSLEVGFGTFEITLTGDAGSNYNSNFIQVTIVILPIWTHPVAMVALIGIAAVVATLGYRQLKWMLKPYVVKQNIKTRRIIKKEKEIKRKTVVKTREKLYMEEYNSEWAYLNMKAPPTVSNDVIKLARQLSDVKRTRTTTAEAKQLMESLKGMKLKEASDYLENTMMIPPDARHEILVTVGIISEEKSEISAIREIMSRIKDEEFTYEEAEQLVEKLKTMKIADADNYLMKNLLISTEYRTQLLTLIGFAPERLQKMRKKGVTPLTVREIKTELKAIPGITLGDRKKIVEELKLLDYKAQTKRLNEIRRKARPEPVKEVKEKAIESEVEPEPEKPAEPEVEPEAEKPAEPEVEPEAEKPAEPEVEPEAEKPAEPELKAMTIEEIEKQLNEIEGMSEEEKKQIAEGLIDLTPDAQRKTIETLKKQYSEELNDQ